MLCRLGARPHVVVGAFLLVEDLQSGSGLGLSLGSSSGSGSGSGFASGLGRRLCRGKAYNEPSSGLYVQDRVAWRSQTSAGKSQS